MLGVTGAFVLSLGLAAAVAGAWEVGQQYTKSEELYMVGGATDVGWVPSVGLQLARPYPNRYLFTITAHLKTDGQGVKFLPTRSGWDGDFGMLAQTWSPYGPQGHGAQGKFEQTNEQNIPPPAVEAIYNFTIDMDNGTWWYICFALCERIDAILPERIAPLTQVTVLYSGKLRGRLLPYNESTGLTCSKSAALLPGCVGGIPRIAAYVRKLRSEGKNVVLADAGEFLYGGDGLNATATAELARMAGYSTLNANMRDFRGGGQFLRAFAKALGPNVSVVMSNGKSAKLSEVDAASGRPAVVGYSIAEVFPGFKVGFLGILDRQSSAYIDDLLIDNLRSDIVATMGPRMYALKEDHQPNLVVVLNSLNDDKFVDIIAEYLLGIQVVLGGLGTSKPPFSLTPNGPLLNYGWQTAYGGKELQQLDITVSAKGKIVDSVYTSTRMDAGGMSLAPDDAVLARAYELLGGGASGGGSEVLGHTSVDIFFEGDPSVMVFNKEQMPMVYLLVRVLYEQCPSCTAAFLHPDIVDSGLHAGPILLSDIARVLPSSGDEMNVDVIEVNGGQLIEGLKEIYYLLVNGVPQVKGLRVSLMNTIGEDTPMTAVQVDLRGGGYVNIVRNQTYRVAVPRWHKFRSNPKSWVTMPVVQELGQLSGLVADFVRKRSPLGPDLLGPPGAVTSVVQLKTKIVESCGSSKPRRELWDLGCPLVFGPYDEVAEMLAPCDLGHTLKCASWNLGTDQGCADYQCTVCETGERGMEETSLRFWSWRITEETIQKQPLQCAPCSPGMYRDAAMPPMKCKECPADTFARGSHSSSCEPCPVHSNQREPGQTVCQCEVGSYKNSSDETRAGSVLPCLPCSDVFAGSTTGFPGALGPEDCVCPEGTFANLVVSGGCQPCPEHMVCHFGSDIINYWDWHRGGRLGKQGPFPQLEESYMSRAEDPLSVFWCKTERMCPGGPPGTCADHVDSSARACALCEEGYMWEGSRCRPCSGAEQSFTFPALPILLAPFVVVFAYRTSLGKVSEWGSWRQGVATLIFLLMNFYQIGTLVRNGNLEYSGAVLGALSTSEFAENPSVVFKPECNGFQDIQMKILIKTLGPIFVAVLVLLTYAGSHIVQHCIRHRHVAFDKDCTINIYLSCMFTFFAGIVAMALLMFKCTGNPNGIKTLEADQSVVCGSSKWNSSVGISIVAVVLYICGFGGVFVWAVLVAPKRFADEAFQKRWKFLFMKFRPNVWWWALPFCAKGVVMNVGLTFIRSGIAQIYWVMLVVSVYCLSVVLFMPWRHRLCSAMDVYTCFAINFLCSLLAVFVHTLPEKKKHIANEVSNTAICIHISPLVVAALIVGKLFYNKRFPVAEVKATETLQVLKPALKAFAMASDSDTMKFLSGLDESTRIQILFVMHAISTELDGSSLVPRLSDGKFKTSCTSSEAEALPYKIVVI